MGGGLNESFTTTSSFVFLQNSAHNFAYLHKIQPKQTGQTKQKRCWSRLLDMKKQFTFQRFGLRPFFLKQFVVVVCLMGILSWSAAER